MELTNGNDSPCNENPCKEINKIIEPKVKDLGDGFKVRRLLPYVKQRMVGPWIFFDHMGPAELSPKDQFDVRPHPHINLSTVTYLFEGEILHKDSLGNDELIRPGEVNLMVAGRGIVHSERERPEIKNTDRKIHGLQLWLALPKEHEETEPAFYHYEKSEIPELTIDDVPVRVLIGNAYDLSSPVKTFCETLYIEARLKKGQKLTLPQSPERALYVADGEVTTVESVVKEHHIAVLNQTEVTITATKDSFVALIGGEPLSRRFIEWNFVSSRKERIEEAKEMWRNQTFPKVPGDSDEFIPLP